MNGMWIGLPVLGLGLIVVALTSASKNKGLRGELRRLEAKVDLLLAHEGLTYDPAANLPPAVVEAIRRNDRIAAIRAYREATGADLSDAKDFVEGIRLS